MRRSAPATRVLPARGRALGRGLVLITVCAGLAAFAFNRVRSMTPFSAPPTVRAALHQHLRTIQEHSGYRLRLDGVLDDSPVIIDEPVQLQYGRGPADPLGFTLPAGRFVLLQQYAGFVYGIRVAPQLGAAPLRQALDALRDVERAIDASAGWQRTGARLDDGSVLEYTGGAEPPRELPVARWTAAGQKLTLSLKRTLEADPAHPTFFASLAIDDVDDGYFHAYRAALHAKRQTLGAADGESLPVLRYWNDTTPPAPVRAGL